MRFSFFSRKRSASSGQGRVSGAADSLAPWLGGRVVIGEVVAFDPYRGLGKINVSSYPQPILFHCIVVTDGSRSVNVGQKVAVKVRAGYGGALEASSVHKL
jgi:cold shock CspA family protein